MPVAETTHRSFKLGWSPECGTRDFLHALRDEGVPGQRGFKTHIRRPVDRRSQGQRFDRTVAQIESAPQGYQLPRRQHPRNLHARIPISRQRILELPMRKKRRTGRQRKWMLYWHSLVSINDTFREIQSIFWASVPPVPNGGMTFALLAPCSLRPSGHLRCASSAPPGASVVSSQDSGAQRRLRKGLQNHGQQNHFIWGMCSKRLEWFGNQCRLKAIPRCPLLKNGSGEDADPPSRHSRSTPLILLSILHILSSCLKISFRSPLLSGRIATDPLAGLRLLRNCDIPVFPLAKSRGSHNKHPLKFRTL